MVIIILAISAISFAGCMIAVTMLRESMRLAREDMETGGGRHRYAPIAAPETRSRWRHANNNYPVTARF